MSVLCPTGRKRGNTRAGLAVICPFKSIPAVLFRLKTTGHIRRVILVAEDDGQQWWSARQRGAARIQRQCGQDHACHGRGQPRHGHTPDRTPTDGGGSGKQPMFKPGRWAARFPRTQRGFQWVHLVHNSLLSNRRGFFPVHNGSARRRCWAKAREVRQSPQK